MEPAKPARCTLIENGRSRDRRNRRDNRPEIAVQRNNFLEYSGDCPKKHMTLSCQNIAESLHLSTAHAFNGLDVGGRKLRPPSFWKAPPKKWMRSSLAGLLRSSDKPRSIAEPTSGNANCDSSNASSGNCDARKSISLPRL